MLLLSSKKNVILSSKTKKTKHKNKLLTTKKN